MLASSAIIDTVADTWREQGLTRTAGRRPGVRVDARRPAAAPGALDSLNDQLFPLATLVTPNLDEVRLLVDIDVVDDDSNVRRPARCTRSARSGHWSRAATCGRRRTAPTCCSTAPTSTSSTPPASTPATITGRRHAGRRDRLRAGARLHRARRGRVREALGDRMPARRIPVGTRPRSGVRAVQAVVIAMTLDQIAGIAHEPNGNAEGVVVLTHGAGGSRDAALLNRSVTSGRAAAGSPFGTTCRTGSDGRRVRRPGPPPPIRPASSRPSSCRTLPTVRSSRAGIPTVAG